MTSWLTTYPFPVFGYGWQQAEPPRWPHRGDTRVGNDVWVERLRAIAWWDWDARKVTRNVRLICAGYVDALERAV